MKPTNAIRQRREAQEYERQAAQQFSQNVVDNQAAPPWATDLAMMIMAMIEADRS